MEVIEEITKPKRKYLIPPEKQKIYSKTFYQKHRNEVLEKIKEKVPCVKCGKCISKSNTSRHLKKNCKVAKQVKQIEEE